MMASNKTSKSLITDPLPTSWRWVELHEAARLVAGASAPQGEALFSESGAWFVRVSDLGGCDSDGVLRATRDRLSELAIATKPVVRVPKGAVVLPKSGAAIATNRRAILGMDAYIVGHLLALIPIPEMILTEWLYFALRQIDMAEHSENASYPSLKKSVVANIEIPLPPLSEQKRIVATIEGQMEAVERARRAALDRIEATRALGAAFLREVFDFSGRKPPLVWKQVSLGDMCRIVNGTTPSTAVADYWGGDVVWITPADLGKMEEKDIYSSGRGITKKALMATQLNELPIGTVVLSSRAPIGHLGIARTPLCTNQGCKSFIPSEAIESEYLYFILSHHVDDFQNLGSGSTFKEISKSKLGAFKIPLPPLAQQKQIIATLDAKMAIADQARAAAEAELEAIEALPGALLRQAFKGEL